MVDHGFHLTTSTAKRPNVPDGPGTGGPSALVAGPDICSTSVSSATESWRALEIAIIGSLYFAVLAGTAVTTRFAFAVDTLIAPWGIAFTIWLMWRYLPLALKRRRLTAAHRVGDEKVARVTCIGFPPNVRWMSEVPDVPFAPEDIRLFFGRLQSRSEKLLTLICTPFCTLIIALTTPAFLPTALPIWIWSGYILAVMSVMASADFLFPTVIEIMPGRLEVWKCMGMRRKWTMLEAFDMREACVRIDFLRNLAVVKNQYRRFEFSLGLTSAAPEMLEKLLLSSQSTHRPYQPLNKSGPSSYRAAGLANVTEEADQ